MRCVMNAKLKLILARLGIPLIVAILSILGYSQFVGIEEVGFVYTLNYDGDMEALWFVLNTFPDGAAVRITFVADGVEIPHSAKMQLMGDNDSSWNMGDWLPLHKQDGVWHEMTRYLKP